MATRTPTGLGKFGGALWKDVTEGWELHDADLRVLEMACRELELCHKIDKELASDTLIVTGSMGQPVVNGLLQELRRHRSTFAALIKQLALPDELGDEGETTTSNARAAAKARWASGA
jgi:hypothetical protein